MSTRSTYLRMWDKIHELSPEARERWIENLSPCTGNEVEFGGVTVLDADLVDALKNAH